MISHHTIWHVNQPYVITVDAVHLPDDKTEPIYQVLVKPPKGAVVQSPNTLALSMYGTAQGLRDAVAAIGEELYEAERAYDEEMGRMRPNHGAAI